MKAHTVTAADYDAADIAIPAGATVDREEIAMCFARQREQQEERRSGAILTRCEICQHTLESVAELVIHVAKHHSSPEPQP